MAESNPKRIGEINGEDVKLEELFADADSDDEFPGSRGQIPVMFLARRRIRLFPVNQPTCTAEITVDAQLIRVQ